MTFLPSSRDFPRDEILFGVVAIESSHREKKPSAKFKFNEASTLSQCYYSFASKKTVRLARIKQ
jgi:hypothetical protein